METDDTPLSLASLDQITNELRRRCKCYAIGMLMPPENGEDSEHDNILYRWAGGSVTALGVACHLKRVLSAGAGEEEDDGE